jgi:hypothetical protein
VILSLIIFCEKTLSMIVPSEINQDDIVKVLVNEDGIEDEMYAVVAMNTGRTLGLHYLSPTDSIYKSACVYKLDKSEMSPAPYDSLMEHYPTGTTFEDLEMKRVDADMYSMYSEIDIEDSDSDVHEMPLESDTDSEMADFVVPDSEVEGQNIMPPDYAAVDKEWNEWKPSSVGARSFKETVDMIETRVRRLSQ